MGPAEFISSAQHRHALRNKQSGEKIAPLSLAQCVDLWIIGWALDPVIPRIIIVVTVAVLFAVRFVVFVIVADEIGQRKSVVRRDKIDAGIGATAIVLVKIGTAGEPVSHFPDAALVPFPETANDIAVFAVPLRPQDGEISDLITAFPNVPRLRN